MPITYYPDSVHKRAASPIELLQKANRTFTWTGGRDLNDGAINSILWPGFPSWTLKQINLFFSTNTAKDYSISKLVGRGVIQGLNDRLWIKADGAPAQEIIIAPGFYHNGVEPATDESSSSSSLSSNSSVVYASTGNLVAELKAKLDTNEAFNSLGLTPFAVSFTASTGIFEITPSAGQIQFFFRNESKPDIHKTSNGGCLIGLTASTALAGSLVSDTPSVDFGVTFDIVSGTGNTSTDIALTDSICMSNDDALLVFASGDMTMSYVASYKED